MTELRELIKAYDLRWKNNSAAFIVALIGVLSALNCLFLIFKNDFNFFGGLGILTIFQMVVFELTPAKKIAMASAIVV